MLKFAPTVFVCLLQCGLAGLTRSAVAANVQTTFTYPSTVTQVSGIPINLTAELNYNSSVTNAPIVVVMHGFATGGDFANVRGNAQRLRDAGFFAVSVAMRGRQSSQGVRDSGGVEVYDIYDAVEAVKISYAAFVNSSNIHITGYSGGGANTMSALTKFPDYFRLGSSYFGMSDYGLDPVNGWYVNGATSSRTPQLDLDIGNPTTSAPLILDKYRARASNLASKNNAYSEIHLFVNANEPICPPINSTSYRDNAIAAQAYPGEFTNITVHIGVAGTYHDFNTNGINEADEEQYWPHGYPPASEQNAGESWYLSRIKNGLIPQPKLNASDNLYVAGWVMTKPFELWLGDGQNAAADLAYSLSPTEKRFTLTILSSVHSVTGRLKVNTSDMTGLPVEIRTNGILAGTFTGGGVYTYNALGDGQTVVFQLSPIYITTGRAGSNMVLNWPQGTLMEATNLTGPWTSNATATPPHTVVPTNSQKYYRLKVQ